MGVHNFCGEGKASKTAGGGRGFKAKLDGGRRTGECMSRALLIAMLVQASAGSADTPVWPSDLPACATASQPARYYPQEAVENALDGDVVLRCLAGDDRHYSGCSILSEEPKGKRFATFALAMAHCSLPLAAEPNSLLTFPVHFRIPGRKAAATTGGFTITAQGHWVR